MPLLPVSPPSLQISAGTQTDSQKVALYGLEVPAGDIIIPAVPDFPATVSFYFSSFFSISSQFSRSSHPTTIIESEADAPLNSFASPWLRLTLAHRSILRL